MFNTGLHRVLSELFVVKKIMAKKLSKRAKKQILNIAFLVVLIGITFTVIFVSQDINIHDLGVFLKSCNPYYILAAFGGLVGYIVFEAISLHIIARKLGHKSKFVSSVAYTTSDLYYSAITPSASGGQPASAFYMVRDGMSGGTAGFTVLFNIISYTIATILVGLFGLIACPSMFGAIGNWFAQLLIILGFVIQLLLLALLLLCLFRARIILRLGNWGISILAKMHIIKKTDKWRTKLEGVVTKYRSCRGVMKKHPMLFVNALLLNTAQRVAQTLIPCFVIMASPLLRSDNVTFLDLFCMQAYVMIGYNSIPLPGGTGVYEYLYPNVFGIGFHDITLVLSAMMVSRFISYYICMIVCGIYTLIYHAVGLKNIKPDEPPREQTDAAVKAALETDGDVFRPLMDKAKHMVEGERTSADKPNDNKQSDEIKPIENKAQADGKTDPLIASECDIEENGQDESEKDISADETSD